MKDSSECVGRVRCRYRQGTWREGVLTVGPTCLIRQKREVHVARWEREIDRERQSKPSLSAGVFPCATSDNAELFRWTQTERIQVFAIQF